MRKKNEVVDSLMGIKKTLFIQAKLLLSNLESKVSFLESKQPISLYETVALYGEVNAQVFEGSNSDSEQ